MAVAREGDRVELVHCTDEFARVPRGTRGTVAYVDAVGTVHVNWDTGHRLGLIPGQDAWKPIRSPFEETPDATA